MKVFVYGTLKRGHSNSILLANATFLGECATSPEYTMYSYGAFPAVVNHGNTPVKGEVYEVNQEVMEDLDRLEGHPRWYVREIIKTPFGDAWIYLMPEHRLENGAEVVELGEWK